MRTTRVPCIVTILLGIIQPLFGQVPQPVDGAALAARVEIVRNEVDDPSLLRELDPIPGEHSFYPDLLVLAESAPRILVMVPLSSSESLVRGALALRSDPSIAILVTAPRHEVRTRAVPALAPPDIPDTVPRILLRYAEHSEWIVSVPDTIAPLWLVRSIRDTGGIPLSAARLNTAYLGFGLADPELEILLDAHLPAVRLDIARPRNGESWAPEVVAALRSLENPPPGSGMRPSDRSFLLLPGARSPIVSEPMLVWSIATIAIVMTIYAAAKPRRVHRYVTAIRHQAGLLVVLFLILWLSLIVSNLILRLLLRLPNVADETLILTLGKLAVGLVVLAALFRTIHPRLRRPSTAFTGAAILFLVLGAIVSAAFTLPIGAYFVSMTIFGFLFSLTPRPTIKALALLLTLLPGLYLVLSLASIADAAMTRAFLVPPVYREVMTAIFLFPILLMFFRLEIITRELPLLVITTMLSIVGIAMISATIITLSLAPADIRATLRESYAGLDTGEISLASSVPLPKPATISAPGRDPILCEQTPCVREIEAVPEPFTVSIDRSSILDRTGIEWTVAFDKGARSMQVRIDADRAVQLYASDIPSRINAVGSTARRFLLAPGPYPPDPVSGEIVVRTDGQPTRLTITVSAEFDRSDAQVSGEEYDVFLVSHTASWSTSREVEIDAR